MRIGDMELGNADGLITLHGKSGQQRILGSPVGISPGLPGGTMHVISSPRACKKAATLVFPNAHRIDINPAAREEKPVP